MQSFDFIEGERFLVNKPLGWTSFDVVNKIRYAIGKRKLKVGHTGTLDPLATGLLIICTGRKTKTIQDMQGMDKCYSGVIRLGATTPSYDLETEVNKRFDTQELTEEAIKKAAEKLTGAYEQEAPIFSAIKVKGRRLYDLAREGKKVEVKKRPITIHSFDIEQITLPDVAFRVECSKGTYIRSLAYDLGKQLNNGGHLAALKRESIGAFQLADAWELPDLVEAIKTYRENSVSEGI